MKEELIPQIERQSGKKLSNIAKARIENAIEHYNRGEVIQTLYYLDIVPNCKKLKATSATFREIYSKAESRKGK